MSGAPAARGRCWGRSPCTGWAAPWVRLLRWDRPSGDAPGWFSRDPRAPELLWARRPCPGWGGGGEALPWGSRDRDALLSPSAAAPAAPGAQGLLAGFLPPMGMFLGDSGDRLASAALYGHLLLLKHRAQMVRGERGRGWGTAPEGWNCPCGSWRGLGSRAGNGAGAGQVGAGRSLEPTGWEQGWERGSETAGWELEQAWKWPGGNWAGNGARNRLGKGFGTI